MNIEQFKQWCELHNQSALATHQQKTLVMGVLNRTPDSFSDGGDYLELERAIERAHEMIAEGADIVDIGGESTRPGSLSVSCAEELARVIPVIEQLRKESEVCISIDTTKPEVMQKAVYAGASIINNIAAFSSTESLVMAARLEVPLCLMHMQGEPQTMQHYPVYAHDVVDEINLFFQQRIESCIAAGIKHTNLILDPGFGFGKTLQHNMRLVNQLAKFQQHNLPIMLGASRKSTLGIILDSSIDKRWVGGLTIAVFAALQGVSIIRTHDIAETKQALIMVQAINEAGEKNNRARA